MSLSLKAHDLLSAAKSALSPPVLAGLLVPHCFLVCVSLEACGLILIRLTALDRTTKPLFIQLSLKNAMHFNIFCILTIDWAFSLVFLPLFNTIGAEGCPALIAFLRITHDFMTN